MVYGVIFFGGDKRDRTADLLNAIQALSQLSYTPKFSCAVRQLLYYNMIRRKVKGVFLIFLKKIMNRAFLHARFCFILSHNACHR